MLPSHPSCRNSPRLDSSNQKRDITLREALSHASGLRTDVSNQLQVLRQGSSLVDVVDRVASGTGTYDVPLDYTPGTTFAYGNVSYQLAGGIAEQLTGQSWVDLFNQNMAQKLDMTSTHYQTNVLQPLPLLAGGAKSTLEDYGNFLQMILNGGTFNGQQVLSQAAIDETLRENTLGLTYVGSPYDDTLYGLGSWLDDKGANGNVLGFTDPGKSGFVPWVDFVSDAYGIIMIDKDGAAGTYETQLNDIRAYTRAKLALVPEPSGAELLVVMMLVVGAFGGRRRQARTDGVRSGDRSIVAAAGARLRNPASRRERRAAGQFDGGVAEERIHAPLDARHSRAGRRRRGRPPRGAGRGR